MCFKAISALRHAKTVQAGDGLVMLSAVASDVLYLCELCVTRVSLDLVQDILPVLTRISGMHAGVKSGGRPVPAGPDQLAVVAVSVHAPADASAWLRCSNWHSRSWRGRAQGQGQAVLQMGQGAMPVSGFPCCLWLARSIEFPLTLPAVSSLPTAASSRGRRLPMAAAAAAAYLSKQCNVTYSVICCMPVLS